MPSTDLAADDVPTKLSVTDPLATDETRIDRWLCAVRLVKTRPLATRLCEGGHVLVNGLPAKPSTKVRAGDRVEALIADRERIVEVVRPIESRVGAAVAATCYVDHSPPVVPAGRAGDHARPWGGPAEQAPAARARAPAPGPPTPERLRHAPRAIADEPRAGVYRCEPAATILRRPRTSKTRCPTHRIDRPLPRSAERARLAGHVDKRLRSRVRIYLVIFVVMLAVVVVDTVLTGTAPILVGLGLLVGVVVGVFVSRMYRLDWDQSANQVVSRIDKIGAAILVAYIVFAVSRSWLVGSFVDRSAVGPVGLSIVCGIMLGRVVGMSHGIRGVLHDAGVDVLMNEGEPPAT